LKNSKPENDVPDGHVSEIDQRAQQLGPVDRVQEERARWRKIARFRDLLKIFSEK
jgi:hypothetical protein